jgi:hypothetical protein
VSIKLAQKKIPWILLLVVAPITILWFQNCAQNKLETAFTAYLYDAGVSGNFCASRKTSANGNGLAGYTASDFLVVPLTAVYKNQDWVADSDVDGIADIDEAGYQFDPVNAYGYAFFDPVCLLVGGNTSCKEAVTRFYADASLDPSVKSCIAAKNTGGSASWKPTSAQVFSCLGKRNYPSSGHDGIGLSSLDLWAFANPTGLTGQLGVDADNDGILDLIEILRGTNPLLNDMSSNISGDGVPNRIKLQRGTNPRQFESLSEQDRTLSYSVQKKIVPDADCNNETWEFSVPRFYVTHVQAYKDPLAPSTAAAAPKKILDFSHAENENLILIMYRAIPSVVGQPIQFWGAILKVPIMEKTSFVFKPTDFYLLGEQPLPAN